MEGMRGREMKVKGKEDMEKKDDDDADTLLDTGVTSIRTSYP